MKLFRTMSIVLVLGAMLFSTARVDAGPWYPPYWGLDARIVWPHSPGWVTIPTGYWYGHYPHVWGGTTWNPYHGWYHPYDGYYHSLPGWGWGGPGWFYGFTDAISFRSFYPWPRVIYGWSRYWDPEDVGYTMDFWTQTDAEGRAMAFFPEEVDTGVMVNIDQAGEFGEHSWFVNIPDGQGNPSQSGLFTDLMWIQASPNALASYLQNEGFDQQTISEILSEPLILDVFASNFDGQEYGEGLMGVQWARYIIPEPASLALLSVGGLVLLVRRRGTE